MSESPSTMVKSEAVPSVNGAAETANGEDHATGSAVIDVVTAVALKAIQPRWRPL